MLCYKIKDNSWDIEVIGFGTRDRCQKLIKKDILDHITHTSGKGMALKCVNEEQKDHIDYDLTNKEYTNQFYLIRNDELNETILYKNVAEFRCGWTTYYSKFKKYIEYIYKIVEFDIKKDPLFLYEEVVEELKTLQRDELKENHEIKKNEPKLRLS
jgi:hypothetical protein